MGMNKKLTIQQKIYRKLCVKFEKYIPDTFYLKMLYKVRMGKKLNLKNYKFLMLLMLLLSM